MTEPELSPFPSLIQQRIVLERDRVIALVLVIGVAISVALVAVGAGIGGWRWFAIAPFLILGYWAYRLVLAHRALRAFERERGSDAGRQHPVGR